MLEATSLLNADHIRPSKASSTTLHRRIALSFVLGLLLVSGAVAGLFVWFSANMFSTSNYTYGYELKHFLGLLAFLALFTPGIVLILASATALGTRGISRIPLWFCGALLVGAGVAAAATYSRQTLNCGVVFCVGDIGVDATIPSPNAYGWRNAFGVIALVTLVPFGGTILIRSAVESFRSTRGTSRSVSASGSSTAGSLGLLLLVTVVLLCMAVCTLFIPNIWQDFLDSSIAANAALTATHNATLCADAYDVYTCPDVPWAVLKTTNWVIREGSLILKLYPGNVLFYSYLLMLLLFAAFTSLNTRGRLFMKRRVALLFGRFSRGEVLLAVWTAALVALFFLYWFHDHNYNNNWQGGDYRGITESEQWARATGQLAVLFLSLALFPASRNSVLHRVLGTSWEASLWAHRTIGYAVLGAIVAHMVSWYKFYDNNNVFPAAIFHVPLVTPIDSDNFTILFASLAGWTLIVVMGVFALGPVRRRFFELFYYLHLGAAYFAIPVVLMHASAGWQYLLPGVTVWFVDHLLRLSRSGRAVEVLRVEQVGNAATTIEFRCPSMSAVPGQYVFLCIPELSLFEWHPFSLSTSEEHHHEGTFSVHIKSMGPSTWTGRLLDLATRSATSGAGLSLSVDGPYGQSVIPLLGAADTTGDKPVFRRVVLVAGGIGVTPCASLYSFIKRRFDTSAVLLWVLREQELARSFTRHFTRASAKGVGESSVRIFLSRKEGYSSAAAALGSLDGPVLSEEVQVYGHRPQIADEIRSAASGHDPNEVLVFACGPESMVAEALSAAQEMGAHFHRETFIL